jgi:hypothetical protein
MHGHEVGSGKKNKSVSQGVLPLGAARFSAGKMPRVSKMAVYQGEGGIFSCGTNLA